MIQALDYLHTGMVKTKHKAPINLLGGCSKAFGFEEEFVMLSTVL